MPPKPTIIKLKDLDNAVREAVRNASGGKLPGGRTPIINGIIIDESRLGQIKPKVLAKEIIAAVNVPPDVKLTAIADRLGNGKILVGFKVQQ